MAGNAREAALLALERCRRDGAWSGAVLDALIRSQDLDRRDAALASQLCLGVLQNSVWLDHVIDAYSRGKLEPKLRDVLRLGAYQLLFLDKIPKRAAVNETVSLCRAAGYGRASGLVNAVLRRISENDPPPISETDPAKRLSIRWSHPEWLVRRLLRDHDEAFVEGFLRCNNDIPPLTLQVNRLKVEPRDYERALERIGIDFESDPELPGCLTLIGGAVRELPGFEEGLFYVQDRAARSAVAAAGLKPGMRVLDACAAPGGKSFAAAMELENRGEILSCDLHEKKLGRIRSGAERLGITILQTRARDGRDPDDRELGSFDAVLADVPCSGLGVIRKRPEIRQKTEEELRELPSIQAEILEHLAPLVKSGGLLLYSTCTVLPEENEEQIRSFLASHPEYRAEDFSLGRRQAPEGMLTFWPQIDGTDGFFVCKLRKS